MSDGASDGAASLGRRNAMLAWPILALVAIFALVLWAQGSHRWGILGLGAVVVMFVPVVGRGDLTALPPWWLVAMVAIPPADATLLGETIISPIVTYVAVALIALVIVLEIDAYTSARMNPTFAVGLVVIATLAIAATWNVGLWVTDLFLETSYIAGDASEDAANRAMMIDFLYATVAGLIAGGVLVVYFRRTSSHPADASSEEPPADEEPEATPSLVRDRLGVSERRVRLLTWALQFVLVGLFAYGLLTRDVPTITNAGIAIFVSFLPAALERNYRLPIEPELIAWVVFAALLHTAGSAGLYDLLGQWDTLTHAMSASIVAATGYTIVRTIDLHYDSVHLPRGLMFVIILMVVLAAGVLWELAEFGIDTVAERYGFEAALAQHGIADTAGDLLANFVGAIIVATAGASYLQGVSAQIAQEIDGRQSG